MLTMAEVAVQSCASQPPVSEDLIPMEPAVESVEATSECPGLIACHQDSIVASASQQQSPPTYSLEFLLRAAARQGRRMPEAAEQQKKLLTKMTHLHLNGLQLQVLNSVKLCPNLQVLYLYDNQLISITNISSNRLITHLYLQNNQLQSLDGLQHLPLLEKLYLDSNQLSVISHLQAATRLEELHVSTQHCESINFPMLVQQQSSSVHIVHQQKQQRQGLQQQLDEQQLDCVATASAEKPAMYEQHQQLVPTGGLAFELASLQAISSSLRVFAAANCGITDPRSLGLLSNLRQLDLSHNQIREAGDLQSMLQNMQHLRSLDLQGNPCARHVRYRDSIILLAADCLGSLDEESIPASHRAFLLGLHLNKLRAQASTEQQQQHRTGPTGQQQQHQAGMLVGDQRHLQQRAEAAAAKVQNASQGRDLAALGLSSFPGSSQHADVSGLGLSGTGFKLHPCKAPAARPPGVAGFYAKAMREGAVLGPAASEWAERYAGQGKQAAGDNGGCGYQAVGTLEAGCYLQGHSSSS